MVYYFIKSVVKIPIHHSLLGHIFVWEHSYIAAEAHFDIVLWERFYIAGVEHYCTVVWVHFYILVAEPVLERFYILALERFGIVLLGRFGIAVVVLAHIPVLGPVWERFDIVV